MKIRPNALLFLLALGAVDSSPVHAQATTVPNEIQQPGTQPGEVSLEGLSKCDNCHAGYDPAVEPVRLWQGGLMSHAGRDPIFWATMAIAEQDFPGAGDLCLRCHSPEGWIDGRSTPTDGSELRAADADGVSCDVCHQLTNPDDSEILGVQNAPFLANDGEVPPEGYYGTGMYVLYGGTEKLGPYQTNASPHASLQSAFHRSSELCGTCHDVSNPAVGDLSPTHGAMTPLEPGSFSGVLGGPVAQKAAFNNFPYEYGVVERTFSEHVASAFPTLSIAAYAGLPAELQAGSIQRAHDAAVASNPPTGDYLDGTPRTFTCQSCHMPPVTGKGCNKPAAPERGDLPLHDLTGGNTWIPEAIQWLDARDDLVLGGGLTTTQEAALDEGVLRARSNLQSAASLSVTGDTLRLVNLTGHKLISGYPEGRRMWVNVQWRDPWGVLVREDGAYGSFLATIEGVPTPVESLLDLEDPHGHVYEVHMGLTQEWAARLVNEFAYAPGLVLTYDRVTGAPDYTLGELANSDAGTTHESFHFVLNDVVVDDDRIPAYGTDWDEAAERNVLPVPSTRYGGPGGTLDYFDEIDLDPPVGASTATIDLYYQSTSWEYVQFLALANDESVVFLADTGEHLLEAWLATGMSAPETMASTTWDALPNDCNNNGVPDDEDIAMGTSQDCNGDGLPDECNIAYGQSLDRNGNGVPDECEPKTRPFTGEIEEAPPRAVPGVRRRLEPSTDG